MSTMTAPAVSPTTAEVRMRTVLRADAVVTGAVGLLGLLGPSWYGGPSWVARAVGAVLVLVAIEVAVLAGSSGRRLRVTGVVVAELAFGWVVAALLAAALVDMDTAGREVLLLSAAGTLGFGIAETRLARRMR
ncbi:MAG TPA: hypothetical protein VM097_01180 [Mycobacteriales bacterium]|nr:hypothetical protein [Mycobacteriales bacterium]